MLVHPLLLRLHISSDTHLVHERLRFHLECITKELHSGALSTNRARDCGVNLSSELRGLAAELSCALYKRIIYHQVSKTHSRA